MSYTFTTPACRVNLVTWLYQLVEPYVYEQIAPRNRYQVVIPKGYAWDGASVPPGLCWFAGIHPGGLMLGPSCLHDAYYQHGGRLPDGWVSVWDGQTAEWGPVSLAITRLEADELFRSMMLQTGLSAQKSWRAFWAVRVGGKSHWGNNSKTV